MSLQNSTPYVQLSTDAPTRARFFFGSRVTRFSRDPFRSSTGSSVPFLQGSYKQKQYQEKTSLHTWGVRQRALQVSQPGYSALTWHHERGPQGPQRRLQERDAKWSVPINVRHIHCVPMQLGTTVIWRYDAPWDWLWDACHMAGVRWGNHWEGFCSKEGPHYRFEQSARNPLERDQVWITTWELYRSCHRTSNNQLYSRERSPVVSLLPGSREHLALRNPHVLCQKHGGKCTTY